MNKGLKKKIINSFTSETPDVKKKIIEKCENQEQAIAEPIFTDTKNKKLINMRFVFACSLVLLFAIGIFTGFAISNNRLPAEAQTIIYLETDASIEISLDKDNKVISCKPLNQTAEKVIADMNLQGMEINTTLNAILGSMHVKGYISSANNSMLVSVVDRVNGGTNDTMLNVINQQITNIFTQSDMQCSLIIQSVSVNEDLKKRADEQGISVGKMFLIDKMSQEIVEDQEETKDILSDLPIRELSLIYTNRRQEGNNELISGSVSGFISEETAWTNAIDFAGMSVSEVKVRSVKVTFSNRDGVKLIYLVELEIIESGKIEKYEVDCTTGEVVSGDLFDYSLR